MARIELQNASGHRKTPNRADFTRWAAAILDPRLPDAEVLIRLVDDSESAALNQTYRGKSGPTNVLSFPFSAPPGVPCAHLGDLVLCAPVVRREADEQGKPVQAHWAHLTVHGILHLLGYDHAADADAMRMEAEEIRILSLLDFANPYEDATTP